MNNKRAIELLHRLQDEQFDGPHGDERREALEMAIRAMEEPKTAGSGSVDLEQPEIKTDRTTGDCINRQQAIEIVRHRCKRLTTACVLAVTEIEQLPSALPERKTGRWIRHIRTDLGPKLNDIIECSECRIAFPTENMFRRSFCPNCGSYNRGESDG